MTFFNESDIGSVTVSSLQPDTLYSFNLTCEGTHEINIREIRIDYGRPSAPQNIAVILNFNRLTVSWSPPLLPAGPINNYRLNIPNQETMDDIPNTQFSYDMKVDYTYGEHYTFFVQACNKNRRNDIICSNPNEGEISFIETTTLGTTTRCNSSEILSCSKLLSIFVFSFLLFHQKIFPQ